MCPGNQFLLCVCVARKTQSRKGADGNILWGLRGLPVITYVILHVILTPSPLFACNTQWKSLGGLTPPPQCVHVGNGRHQRRKIKIKIKMKQKKCLKSGRITYRHRYLTGSVLGIGLPLMKNKDKKKDKKNKIVPCPPPDWV